MTGHTGFKGSWLSLWLTELGAKLSGLALAPETEPNHWELLGLRMNDLRADVRDQAAVARAVEKARPEVIFHLAAQPLVRRSYRDPVQTWSTNVMGTAHLLDACRQTGGVQAVVVVTTDKIYQNREWPWGYRESDRIGGHDPYSSSKGAVELLTASYRDSFCDAADAPLIATARAGNVIGGGDWSEDRLVPDLIRSLAAGVPLEIRSPGATRPWQHVLECLSGYLLLGQKLLAGERALADAWNFGPEIDSNRSVAEVLDALSRHLPGFETKSAKGGQPHEATMLYLDSSKAKSLLLWHPVWSLDEGVAATALWYRCFMETGKAPSREQLAAFVAQAASKGAAWVEA